MSQNKLPHFAHLLLKLSAVCDDDFSRQGALSCAETLDSRNQLKSTDDLSKYAVFAVEVRGKHSSDEELGSVGVGTRISHGQETNNVVLQGKVFISEFGSVNALASSSISSGEIATLQHELGDYSMERAPLVVQVLATLALVFASSSSLLVFHLNHLAHLAHCKGIQVAFVQEGVWE